LKNDIIDQVRTSLSDIQYTIQIYMYIHVLLVALWHFNLSNCM